MSKQYRAADPADSIWINPAELPDKYVAPSITLVDHQKTPENGPHFTVKETGFGINGPSQ